MKTTRRDFLKTSALGAAALSTGCMTHRLGASRTAGKPNLLLIWTDQQRFDTLKAYGNGIIQAPRLNRLAQQSQVFERAYVSQPVCSPSRSTVMTGLYPHQNGVINNNLPFKPGVKCLPELLADADYATGYVGKWHLGNEIFPQHGFDEWYATEDGYDRWFTDGRSRDERSAYHQWLLEKGYKPDAKHNIFWRRYCTTLPEEHCKPAFQAEKAVEFLRRHKDEPFVLSVNYLEPHNPFNGPLNELHDPASIKLPDNWLDDFDENDPLRVRFGQYRSKKGKRADNGNGLRDLTAIYYGMITQVDRSVGRILDELDRLGMAENTIIAFTSDHGDMMGSHGMGGKSVMFEESVRVPFMVKVPGMKGKRIADPVCNVDLVPTLLDLAGSDAYRTLPGQSLVPLMKGGQVAEDHVFVQWNAKPRPLEKWPKEHPLASQEALYQSGNTNIRAVISPDGWKLCISDQDKNELYNLVKDPGETTNLYSDAACAPVVARLTQKIRDWQSRHGDTMPLEA